MILPFWGSNGLGRNPSRVLDVPCCRPNEFSTFIDSDFDFVLPMLAVGARRLHDIGKSGWWQLIALTIIGIILLIVWWATNTKSENSKFGEVAT